MLRPFRNSLLAACGALLLATGAPALAQGVLDPGFAPTVLKRASRNGDFLVRAMLQQPDGKILVGGNSDFVDNQLTSRLRRLNADGTPDLAFAAQTGTGPDPAALVGALALQSTGNILVGGANMMFYNQVPTGNLARLTPAGAVDAAFNAGGTGFGYDPSASNPGNNIRSLAVQPDDKVLVGGFIGSYNGQPTPNLVRLNANGTLDAGFNVGSLGFSNGGGANTGIPEVIVVQPDGKIVVGGTFGDVNGTAAFNLVRLNANGTVDNTFLSTGTNGTVRGLVRQPDGKLLVGGLFTQVNGQASGSLARLNPDGTLDAGFAGGTLNSNGGAILKVRLRADGTVYTSGTFSSFNGVARAGVAKVSAAGVLDPSFGPAVGTDNIVYELLDLTTGQTLAGGIFTTFGGVARTGLARLNSTATVVDAAYNPVLEFRGTLNEVTPLANGELYIDGNYTSINGTPVAASNGTRLHVLSPSGAYSRTLTLNNPAAFHHLPQADGTVYLVATTPQNVATLTRHLATGAPDAAFAAVTLQLSPNLLALFATPLPGGDVLWSGNFSAVNGQARPNLARITAAGVLTAFNPPTAPWQTAPTPWPTVVGVQPNGQPLVSWDDATRTYLVRLSTTTGAIDNSFAIGAPSPGIFTAHLQPNGQVLLGGLSSLGGQPVTNGLVRLTPTGQIDPSFAAALPFSIAAVQPDGRLLVVTDSGLPYPPALVMRRLNANGSLDASFPTVTAPVGIYLGSTARVKVQPQDGKILLYGGFTTVNGQPRIGLARLTNTLLATRPALAAAPPLDVFPNPAQALVTLRLPAGAVSATPQPVDLLDMQGRTVRRFTLPARHAEATFSLADVAAGVYLLHTRTAQGPARQRVVVTH